jgi:ubiquinone/menaquinone biosynthesis C-methylase UbiE
MSDKASLSAAWEDEAESWVSWARKPGHDSYWNFHRDIFRELLPEPSGRALDVGCGEGRLPRDLKSWGYDVVGLDASPTLIAAAREADPSGEYRVADAAELPFEDETFALVTAFMSLQDIDRYEEAIAEIGRVLVAGGYLCLAIVHPLASAGEFLSRQPDSPFVIAASYLEPRRIYGKPYVRAGMSMTFHSVHRALQAYFDALIAAGFKVDRLVEVPDATDVPGGRWQRVPNFLDLRAQKS